MTTRDDTAPITRVGLQLSSFSFPGVPDTQIFQHAVAIAQTAERSGFDSLWVMDHLHQIPSVGERTEPMLEAYTTLAGLAASTTRARLGVLVSAGGFRHPALLAKMVTTIDLMSGGRAVLGLGAGWHAEEYEAYGIPFPPLGERMRRLSETIEICRLMFTEHEPVFAGRYFSISAPLNVPRPVRPGGPPILVGGSGERKLIPMVARQADGCNFFGGPATVRHKIDVLLRACEAVGRDPATITKTWLGPILVADSDRQLQEGLESVGRLLGVRPSAVRALTLHGSPDEIVDQVGRYREVGVDGLMVAMDDAYDLGRVERAGAILSRAMEAATPDAGAPASLDDPVQSVTLAWADALGLQHIDPDVGFFDLGADSVTAVRAINTLRRQWPHLQILDAFMHPTVTALASFISSSTRSTR